MEKLLNENETNEKLRNNEDYMFLMSILPSVKKLKFRNYVSEAK